jgi:hypothetical protein
MRMCMYMRPRYEQSRKGRAFLLSPSAMPPSFWPSFEFDTAPLSSAGAPLITGVIYLAVVVSLARRRAHRQQSASARIGVLPLRGLARRVMAAHNLALSAASAVMFLGTLTEVRARAAAEGAGFLLCESPQQRPAGSLYAWSYMYYLSK